MVYVFPTVILILYFWDDVSTFLLDIEAVHLAPQVVAIDLPDATAVLLVADGDLDLKAYF